MEDVSPVQSAPKQQHKQQAPSWVTDRVATRLGADEIVGDVQGEEEAELFMQLLPQFVPSSSNSSSALRVSANSVDFRAMADAWNESVPGLRGSRQAVTYKQQQQLRTYFTKVSTLFRGPLARQKAQTGSTMAAAAAAGAGSTDGAAAAAAAGSTGGVAAGDQHQAAAWQQLFRSSSAAGAATGGVNRGSLSQLPSKPPAKGTGKGGAGAPNTCVPCTLTKMQQLMDSGALPQQKLTADDARMFSGYVHATHAHLNVCPFCKGSDCKKAFSKRGPIDPASLTLKKNCQCWRVTKRK
jgi:hypothetical protein